MESMRIRLVFEDRQILSKSQKSEGLKQSWLLLRPEHEIISDLSSHLLHIFDLHQSCPHGLLLSIDDFVLPPFESTCILKDNDIIGVKKKKSTLSEVLKLGDAVNSGEDIDVVEEQPVGSGLLLLANEKFEKESGGYQSESEEDEEEDRLEEILHVENLSGVNAISKKRKVSKRLKSPKKKRKRLVAPESVENDDHPEQIESNWALPKKNLCKEKIYDVKSKLKSASNLERDEICNDNVEFTPSVKRCDQIQDNDKGTEDMTHVPEETKKLPSRSARRKKAKRKWLREMAKIGKKGVACQSNGFLHWKKEPPKFEKKELHWKKVPAKSKKKELHWKKEPAKSEKEVVCHSKGLLYWKQTSEKDMHKNIMEKEQPNQKSGADDDIVPIVIRPGHIRFEPLEKDQTVHQGEVSTETFQWNGISSKKKGQNWGTEKPSSSRRSDPKALNNEHSEMLNIEKEKPLNDSNDFAKLPPLTRLPKEGDIIAYCLLELSASFTPEISSFRVGKVSCYDTESRKIMLIPVPEYPIVSEKSEEDKFDDSPYSEDGSLEIDFSLLLDVRIVMNCGNLDPAKAVTDGVSQGPAYNTDIMSSMVPITNEIHASFPEKGEVNPWDELSKTLDAKKAELSQEKGWGKESPARNPLTYRASRSRYLPSMASFRSKKAM